MGTDQGALDCALQTLLAQHQGACDWAKELAGELQTAQQRTQMLAQAVQATADLLPQDQRDRALGQLVGHEILPRHKGSKAAALRTFLRQQQADFSPTDLATWLSRTGHPVKAPRDAARMLSDAVERGQVVRVVRGRYRVLGVQV